MFQYGEPSLLFKNSLEENLTLDEVFQRVLRFIQEDPKGKYHFMIGTDSHVYQMKGKPLVLFASGIVIQREGNGIWACHREEEVYQKMELHERITHEVTKSLGLVHFFDEEKLYRMYEIVFPYIKEDSKNGSQFISEIHMDIGFGKRNKTGKFVKEMEGMVKGSGYLPMIKPYAFVASHYANYFTKKYTTFRRRSPLITYHTKR